MGETHCHPRESKQQAPRAQLRQSTGRSQAGPGWSRPVIGSLAQQPCRFQARFLQQPVRPSPQSQSLSRGYGSNLPTSLTYIVLSTRGCSPWRPAADIGTAWHESRTASPGFSRADGSAPDTAGSAVLYGATFPISGRAHSRESGPLQRKENSSRDSRRRLLVRLRRRSGPPTWRGRPPWPGAGNVNPLPFRSTAHI